MLWPYNPPSPYWIPLWGSSGSISPSSIFVRMIRASRLKSSSTPSPVNAETSTDTGILDLAAQRDVSSRLTSRPSGANVAVNLVPAPRLLADRTEPAPNSSGNEDCLLDALDGVGGARELSSMNAACDDVSDAISDLFPASMTVRFGDARALASIRNVGRAVKEV